MTPTPDTWQKEIDQTLLEFFDVAADGSVPLAKRIEQANRTRTRLRNFIAVETTRSFEEGRTAKGSSWREGYQAAQQESYGRTLREAIAFLKEYQHVTPFGAPEEYARGHAAGYEDAIRNVEHRLHALDELMSAKKKV